MASGIEVNNSVFDFVFFSKKRANSGRKYRALQLAISSNNTELVIEKQILANNKISQDRDFELITAALPRHECRYLIFCINYIDKDDKDIGNFVFIEWSPDSASDDKKVLYSSNRNVVKSLLNTGTMDFFATDKHQLKFKNFCKSFISFFLKRALNLTNNKR